MVSKKMKFGKANMIEHPKTEINIPPHTTRSTRFTKFENSHCTIRMSWFSKSWEEVSKESKKWRPATLIDKLIQSMKLKIQKLGRISGE